MKSMGSAYIIWFFFGLIGLHRFYLDSPVVGLIQFFTLGGFGMWWLLDFFLIPGLVNDCNMKLMLLSRGGNISQQQAVNVVVQAPPPSQAAPPSSGGGSGGPTRPCPQCGEDIKVLAKICRFCRAEVPPLQALG